MYWAFRLFFHNHINVHVVEVVTETGQVVEPPRRDSLQQREWIWLRSLTPLCARHRGRERAVCPATVHKLRYFMIHDGNFAVYVLNNVLFT